MTTQDKINNAVVAVAAKVGERFGNATGYLSTRVLNENLPQKIRLTVVEAVGTIDNALNAIDEESSTILNSALSELKKTSGNTLTTIGTIARKANDRVNLLIQQGTFYVIDFAGGVKTAIAKLKK